ncbi:uncharacterized protein ColSpa_01364 [Colletotrichum spaethianum]|uniref:Uncharacterized protein n=1 Tax=Colletotrichum spaethianum TaxID=700344 RepID=A0AA37NYI0_9PEZI|nr:uncharacterized protein ColSpa_01364 [Colletotrichum spaethianum]GKT41183.1 hypothetical protein ColSpa_01364 [Colletotrichum spaethianum]
MIFRQITTHPVRLWLPEGVSPARASNRRGTTSDILASQALQMSSITAEDEFVVGAVLRLFGREQARSLLPPVSAVSVIMITKAP